MKVKFGVQLWLEVFEIEALRKAWRELEDMGYYSAWIYDHFHPMSQKTSYYIPEARTLLPYLAAETERQRLAATKTATSHSNPLT